MTLSGVRAFACAFAAAFVAAFVICANVFAAGSEDYIGATVVRVYDGDTIQVRISDTGRREKVRFIAIDCPEARRNDKFERDIKKPGALKPEDMLRLGGEARDVVDGLAGPGTRVRLELDGEKRDRYGRLLAYVYAERDGELLMLNEELLRLGLARAVDYGQNHRHLERFREIESGARKAGLGMWFR